MAVSTSTVVAARLQSRHLGLRLLGPLRGELLAMDGARTRRNRQLSERRFAERGHAFYGDAVECLLARSRALLDTAEA